MASMRDIKRRRTSIQSTQQITKAMKLVSTVKLQKARGRAEDAYPYFTHVYEAVTSLLSMSDKLDHPYLQSGQSEKAAVIVISSNRGLAGGYNSNIVKKLTGSTLKKENVKVYAVGGKARDSLRNKGYEIAADHSAVMEHPHYADAMEICHEVLEAFTAGEIGEIYMVYTHFKNTVSHIPTMMKLLPVEFDEADAPATDKRLLMNYEPNEEEVLNLIIPKYVTSLFYGAFVDALASENGARMQAMDSATSNAEDMISDLTLKYNRVRQGTITQELTEIIAGAEAIS
ncbi:ATP synthase gamma chain [Clostridia bacterium]|nr:ATP synthase gamma chain [Clostridia bacterium]